MSKNEKYIDNIVFFYFICFMSNTNIANTNNTNVIMSTSEDESIVFEQKDVVYNIDYRHNVVYANKNSTDLTLQIMIPRALKVDTYIFGTGTADGLVPFNQSKILDDKLKEENRVYEFYAVKDADHSDDSFGLKICLI